ncbi:hypothetical protein MBLNU457_3959t1 [Dothideomycetes sp. NU457]
MGSSNSKIQKHDSVPSSSSFDSDPPKTPTTPLQPYNGVPRSWGAAHLPTYSTDSNNRRISSIISPYTPAHPLRVGDPGISPPGPAKNLRKLSELIDPTTIFDDEWAVQSPSGNILGRSAYEIREDRPLSMRERQERIRMEVMRKDSYVLMGMQSIPEGSTAFNEPSVGQSKDGGKKRGTSRRCFCF